VLIVVIVSYLNYLDNISGTVTLIAAYYKYCGIEPVEWISYEWENYDNSVDTRAVAVLYFTVTITISRSDETQENRPIGM
jgi:hypothetical protein